MSCSRINEILVLGSEINKFDLKIGQWIKFSAGLNLNRCRDDVKAIYDSKQIFLVLSRKDNRYDDCRCILIDIKGCIYDYCPRINIMNYASMHENQKIWVVSNENVISMYGYQVILSLYEKAKEYTQNKISLNVESEIQKIKFAIENNADSLKISSGLFPLLPNELSTLMGGFLNSKKVGLVQAEKKTSISVNEENSLSVNKTLKQAN